MTPHIFTRILDNRIMLWQRLLRECNKSKIVSKKINNEVVLL